MTDKIEPALSAEEWADKDAFRVIVHYRGTQTESPALAVAVSNDQLPDSDPRKITRELIDKLRLTAFAVPDGYSPNIWLDAFADALESYLPPP